MATSAQGMGLEEAVRWLDGPGQLSTTWYWYAFGARLLLLGDHEDFLVEGGRLPWPAAGWLDDDDPHPWFLPARGREFLVGAVDPVRARDVALALAAAGHAVRWLEEPWPALRLAGRARCDQERAALWEPDPWVAAHGEALVGAAGGDPIVDAGCGSGRDVAFLLCLQGRLLGIDRLPDALELARRRADGMVRGELALQVAQLRGPAEVVAALGGRPAGGLLCVAFLSRELLAGAHELVRPGGRLLLSAFAERGEGGRGPRRARFRLAEGELAGLLPAAAWEPVAGPELVEQAGDWRWRGVWERRR